VPVSESRIVYQARDDATPAGEVSALAVVYKFVLDSKKAAEQARKPGGHDDQERLEQGAKEAGVT
jgi:hypothetical protein